MFANLYKKTNNEFGKNFFFGEKTSCHAADHKNKVKKTVIIDLKKK